MTTPENPASEAPAAPEPRYRVLLRTGTDYRWISGRHTLAIARAIARANRSAQVEIYEPDGAFAGIVYPPSRCVTCDGDGSGPPPGYKCGVCGGTGELWR